MNVKTAGRLDEKIALITGAASGIGWATAELFAAEGAIVILADRAADKLSQRIESLVTRDARHRAMVLDVTSEADWLRVTQEIDREFGRLDVLVNNAGISGGWGQEPTRVAPETVRAVFETNFYGVLRVTNAMVPLLLRSPAPRVVNVSSGVGSLAVMTDPASPLAGLPASAAYPPSKTALNALTVQYAKELRKDNVLVNAIDPGYCATEFNNHTGYRTPAQGAAVAVRLATVGSDGPTGGFFGEDGPLPW